MKENDKSDDRQGGTDGLGPASIFEGRFSGARYKKKRRGSSQEVGSEGSTKARNKSCGVCSGNHSTRSCKVGR